MGLTAYVVLLFSLSVHESAHAWMAHKLGDDTALREGRITPEPDRPHRPHRHAALPAHADLHRHPVPGLGQAHARTTRATSAATSRMRRATCWWPARGRSRTCSWPLLFTAGFFVIVRGGLVVDGQRTPRWSSSAVGIQMNVVLALFNLVPIPPLDGSKVASYGLPGDFGDRYDRVMEPYGYMILLVLLRHRHPEVRHRPDRELRRPSCCPAGRWHDPSAHPLRHAAHGAAAPGPPDRRARQLGARCRTSTSASSASWTGTRSPPTTRPLRHPGQHPGGGHRLAGRRARPRALHALHPEPGARARGAAPAALDGHAAAVAGAGADLQGAAAAPAGEGPLDLRLPRLPAAADRGHHHLQGGRGAGGRGPGPAHRADPRDRAPLQQLLRPRLPGAEDAAHGHAARARAPTAARCRSRTATPSS